MCGRYVEDHVVTWAIRSLLTRLFIILVLVASTSASVAQDGNPNFDRDVAPILVDCCLDCHSGSDPDGGLVLNDRTSAMKGGESGHAIVPNSASASFLWQQVSTEEMPPKKPLSHDQKQILKEWIDSGAKWGTTPIDPLRVTSTKRAGYDWWAWQPLKRPQVPVTGGSATSRNPIDAFILRRLALQGLSPSPVATPRTLIRRLWFDLLGLPPAPEEVAQFEAEFQNGDSGEATLNLIDRLLSSNRFGERWSRHWLDVVRFGESQGFERDRIRPNAWYYRDWVIHAMNSDMPYDEFVRLQIAGDILYPDDPNAVIATGFLVAGPWDEVGQKQQSTAMKAVVRQDEIEDYVGTIGQTFLGLTINCARCHDHKFDPIRQQEYYQIAAAVAGVRHGSRDIALNATNKDESGRLFLGAVEENATKQGQQPSFSVYAVTPKAAETTYVLNRGNALDRQEVVAPGGVAAVTGVDSDFGIATDAPDSERRRLLADWITGDSNPLFSRVIVNRLWHYHFGTGLVATPNDFGFNGGTASHPELLDWLALELVDSGWRLKHIHRLIVSSATYQQTSRNRMECLAIDASNRLLWRKSPMRLEAEALRDSILKASGQLDLSLGGPPYQDYKTTVHNSQFYTMVDLDVADAHRRTVYRTWLRSGRNHFLDAFDCPDPSTTAPKRTVTTTPIQSLTLMNGSFVLRMADRFAERVRVDAGDTITAQIVRAYRLAFARSPDSAELEQAFEFVTQHGLPAICRVLINSNEFIYVD